MIQIKAISDRVINVTLKMNYRYNLQIIQTYAPTSTADKKMIVLLSEGITAAGTSENAKYVIVMEDLNGAERDEGLLQ